MSIILRALKKIQDQQEGLPSSTPDGEESIEEKAAADAVAVPAPAQEAAEEPESGPRRPTGAMTAGESGERVALLGLQTARHAPRHRFDSSPVALLILLVCLGVFTTGWFASRIYVNTRLASDATAPEIPPKTPPVIEQTPVADRAARIVRAEEIQPPPSQAQPVEIAPAQIEPPSTGAAAPAPEIAPASPEPQPARVSVIERSFPVEQPITAQAPPPESVVPAAPAIEPTQPPAAVKEAQPLKRERPKLKINAIAWRNEEPKAIVNMQSVYEGDFIEGATVLAIRRKRILFEFEGETFEVRF